MEPSADVERGRMRGEALDPELPQLFNWDGSWQSPLCDSNSSTELVVPPYKDWSEAEAQQLSLSVVQAVLLPDHATLLKILKCGFPVSDEFLLPD